MTEHERMLLERVERIEDFQAGMSRRLIFARGEAMASTHCLAGLIEVIGGGKVIEKSSMETVIRNAGAALDKQRELSDPKTQAAVDHAKLLLKCLQINLQNRNEPAIMFAPAEMERSQVGDSGGGATVNS